MTARLIDEARNELGTFSVATPCHVPWSQMKGDDRVRHCGLCNLDVTNIEALTTAEAQEVLRRVSCGGRVCVRYFRRFDGTVLTKDCEGGLRSAWRVAMRRRRATSSALSALSYLVIALVTAGVVLTLFGDNIRRLFGMSAGGLAGNDRVEMRQPPPTEHKLIGFGQNNAY